MTDDIEHDLSILLTQQAGHPHTDVHYAMAEHDRRMRARSRAVRTRAVAGATAMVALIGIGTALAVDHPASMPRPHPISAAAPPPARPASDPVAKLADFTAQGKQWTAYVMVSNISNFPGMPPGSDKCVEVVGVPAGAPPTSTDRYPNAEGCTSIQVFPNDPLVAQLAALPAADTIPGPLPNITVWITVPAVSDISVVRSGGDTIHGSLLINMPNYKVFVTSQEIKSARQYTFRDAHGTILRQDNL